MKKQKLLLIIIVLLAMPLSAAVGDSGFETGDYTSESFHWVQEYRGWGPACYYGKNVRIVYDATNKWRYVVKNGDIQETLVQDGTAKIYDMDLNLIDDRPFTATERFLDVGTDVAVRHDFMTSVWYQVSHHWLDSNLEDYQYVWRIPGVYDYQSWNRNGIWRYQWASGECKGGYPDRWPPMPPHPFTKNTGP
jgi:hypothetical protein